MMKTTYWILCALCLWAQNVTAQNTEGKRIFFPYFRLADAPKTIMPLSPQDAHVFVQIDGLRATVKVQQIYKNNTEATLALTCVVPTDIDMLEGYIGSNLIIRKPNLPQGTYEHAQQPLSMPEVAAGSEVKIAWNYTVLCAKEGDLSVFRFPAFLPSREGENLHYDLKVSFHTELPIAEITSQEHFIEVHYPSFNTAEVSFADNETQAGSRPLVLSYKFHGSTTKIVPKHDDGVMRGGGQGDYSLTYQHVKEGDQITDAPDHTIHKDYEVKENDYLEKIADKYGVTVANIKTWNHHIKYENGNLKKGQFLKLEVPCVRITHIVAEDEYPYQIAQFYDVKSSELLEWNGLKSEDKLYIGQKIIVYKVKK